MVKPARPIRRTVAQQETKSVWRYRVITLALVIVFGSVALFLWKLHPRKVICRTVEYTICPPEVEQAVHGLRHSPYRRLERDFVVQQQAILSQQPTIVEVQLRKKFDLSAEVVLTPAEPLFPVQRNNQLWMVHATGILTETDDDRLPLVTMATESAWIANGTFLLSTQQRLALGKLWKELQAFQPGFKRLELIEPTQLVGITTNSKRVYFTATSTEEVQRQLATLQSFLHSSTMEGDWQEVDVRFADIIVR